MRALYHFRHRRHEVIVFHVFDKAEIDFPFRDTVAFHDLETRRADPDRSGLRPRGLPGGESSSSSKPTAAAARRQHRLRADRHLDPLRFHALPIHRQTQPAMTFLAPFFLLADAGRRDPGDPAHDQPPEGQGAALQHAAVPADQRAEDAAPPADPRRAADDRARGGAAADRRGVGPADGHQPELALGAAAANSAVAIVLDNSASMGAIDGGGSRASRPLAARSSRSSASARRRPGRPVPHRRPALSRAGQARPHAATACSRCSTSAR